MKSDSPRVHRHNRLMAFIHKILCATCRRSTTEWTRLSRGIERLEDDAFPPSLDEKLLSDAMTASAKARQASPIRSRASEVFTMRRALYGGSIAVVLLLAVAFLFPRSQGNSALADVARAMASVKSMHVVGWKVNGSGEKQRIEIWAKADGRCRIEYGDTELVVDDGEKLVSQVTYNGEASVSIYRSGEFPDLGQGMSYLDLFMGEQMVKKITKEGQLGLAGSQPTTLPDGRKAVVMELRSGPAKALITVDAKSNLVQELQAYDADGSLRFTLDQCEYDLSIPDSVFAISIPGDAVVIDQRVPVSEDREKWREAMEERLYANGAGCACKIHSGESGTQYHSGLRFRCLGRDGIGVYYFPKRNTYYVLGRALMHDKNSDFRRIVEDGEVRAPRKSDYVPPPPPPPLTPEELKANAMIEKANVPGAKSVFKSVRGSGGSCGTYHNGLTFHMKWSVPLRIQYLPDTNTYRITGKVEVWYPNGKTEVVENEDIKAPGPPDRE